MGTSCSSLLSLDRSFFPALFLLLSKAFPPPQWSFSSNSIRLFPGEEGETFSFSLLSSSPSLSAVAFPHPSVIGFPFSFFFFFFSPLSSGAFLSSLLHLDTPSQPPLASFYPLQLHRSWFYSSSHLQFFPSQICRPSFLLCSNGPHRVFPCPNFLLISSPPCSSHHAHAHGSHALPCVLWAAARSSPTSLHLPCPLFKLLFSGIFYCVCVCVFFLKIFSMLFYFFRL